MEYLKGITVSGGIAIGKVFVFKKTELKIVRTAIIEPQVNTEIAKLDTAVKDGAAELQRLYETAGANMDEDRAEIYKAHLDILHDPILYEGTVSKITSELKNAGWALSETLAEICAMFESLGTAYQRERANDVRDVGDLVLRSLCHVEKVDLHSLPYDCIVIARELFPSDTAEMDMVHIRGFATELGGETSHASIIAKSLGLPAMVGVNNVLSQVKNGMSVIIDGDAGELIISPDEEILSHFKCVKAEKDIKKNAQLEQARLPALTKSGRKICLEANISNAGDAERAMAQGADGVGLFRTEFLFMDRKALPGEEEQFLAYKAVCDTMRGKPIVIRTLDVGGDKPLPYLPFPEETNPFLGWRAIRVSLECRDMFRTQLRAILRASAYGKVSVMLPMVISLSDFRQTRELLRECMEELEQEGIPYDKEIEVGIMAETPAVTLQADSFAKEVDFFSIGTNDLTQYTLAVDRGNAKVSRLYNPLHPAMVESIRLIVEAAHRYGKRVKFRSEPGRYVERLRETARPHSFYCSLGWMH